MPSASIRAQGMEDASALLRAKDAWFVFAASCNTLTSAPTLGCCGLIFHGEHVISAHYGRVRQRLMTDPKVWLVTGVAGFIGSNLLEELLALGQTVIGLDNFATGYRANLDDALGAQNTGRFRMVEGDIRDLDGCEDVCRGVDYVLHHAALGSVPWSIEDPLETTSVNVNGFVNMLVAAKSAGVKRFVYASSSAVYGDSADQPQAEDKIGKALSPYAASKLANETYAEAFEASYGLPSIGLRYFNVFGRRQDPAGAYAAVIPRWVDALLTGRPCQIFGDGETTRDFCYIANVVQANILAATASGGTRQTYNIACGRSVSLNDLFTMLRDQLAVEDPAFADVTPQYESFRAGDVRFSCSSIAKAREMLLFTPTHDVSRGISEAVPWYAGHSLSENFVPLAGS